MRITIEIEDGGTSIRTTESAVPAQPGVAETAAGATAAAAVRTTAAAVGARDGGPAPHGPGAHSPASVPGAGSVPAAESGAPGAPEAFLRLTAPPSTAGLGAGAAPGAPPVPAYEIEQGDDETAASAPAREAEERTPPGKAGRAPRSRR